MLISFTLGFQWGFLREKSIHSPRITSAFSLLAYIIMIIPGQINFLLFSYFFSLFNISFNEFTAAIALGIYSSAFTSEIVISSFETIPFSQWKLIHNIEQEHNKKEITSTLFFPPLNTALIRLIANESDHILKHIPFLSCLSIFEFNRSIETMLQINKNYTAFYIYIFLVYGTCSLLIRFVSLHLINKTHYEEDYKS